MWGLSLVAASGGQSSSRCAGLSLSWPLLLQSTGSRRAGSVVVVHGPSCSAACGIFPYQGSNPCPLHWQADSQPLRHQGSPRSILYNSQKVETTQISINWWVDKMWYIHLMKHNLAIKGNEVLIQTTAWMNPDLILYDSIYRTCSQ